MPFPGLWGKFWQNFDGQKTEFNMIFVISYSEYVSTEIFVQT
jgi:hypothetical protein